MRFKMKMKTIIRNQNLAIAFIFTLALALISVASVTAQAQQRSGMGKNMDRGMGMGIGTGAFDRVFFSPQIIMRNQQEINLTDAQRETIQKLTAELHSKHSAMRWDLQNELQTLKDMIDSNKEVDITEANAQLEKVLVMENDMKRSAFEVMMKIKNELSEEQIDKLSELRGQRRENMRGPGKRSGEQRR